MEKAILDKVIKRKEYDVAYYEKNKKDEVEKVQEEFKKVFPNIEIPVYEYKKGHSIEKYKKILLTEILGKKDMFEFILGLKEGRYTL